MFKVLTSGEGGVGKTTLLHRYVDGKFLAETRMTIGLEFFLKELTIDKKPFLLQLWDFGGQTQFRFMLDSYVHGAKGALLVFDLTRPSTLLHLDNWINIVRSENPKLPVLFIGTKADLTEKISIDDAMIQEVKEKYDLFYYLKVSSKTGENVNLAFELLCQEIKKRLNL